METPSAAPYKREVLGGTGEVRLQSTVRSQERKGGNVPFAKLDYDQMPVDTTNNLLDEMEISGSTATGKPFARANHVERR